jgi:hypothetical protein
LSETFYRVQKCKVEDGVWEDTWWGLDPKKHKSSAPRLTLPEAHDGWMDAVESPSASMWREVVSAFRVVKMDDGGGPDLLNGERVIEVVSEQTI